MIRVTVTAGMFTVLAGYVSDEYVASHEHKLVQEAPESGYAMYLDGEEVNPDNINLEYYTVSINH